MDRIRNLLGKGAGIADAGGATITNQVKAQRIQIVLKIGFFEQLSLIDIISVLPEVEPIQTILPLWDIRMMKEL